MQQYEKYLGYVEMLIEWKKKNGIENGSILQRLWFWKHVYLKYVFKTVTMVFEKNMGEKETKGKQWWQLQG